MLIVPKLNLEMASLILKDQYTQENVNNFILSIKFHLSNSILMGKIMGNGLFYFPNRNLQTIANFNLGTRVGIWKFYHENGSLWKVNNYSETGENRGLEDPF